MKREGLQAAAERLVDPQAKAAGFWYAFENLCLRGTDTIHHRASKELTSDRTRGWIPV